MLLETWRTNTESPVPISVLLVVVGFTEPGLILPLVLQSLDINSSTKSKLHRSCILVWWYHFSPTTCKMWKLMGEDECVRVQSYVCHAAYFAMSVTYVDCGGHRLKMQLDVPEGWTCSTAPPKSLRPCPQHSWDETSQRIGHDGSTTVGGVVATGDSDRPSSPSHLLGHQSTCHPEPACKSYRSRKPCWQSRVPIKSELNNEPTKARYDGWKFLF